MNIQEILDEMYDQRLSDAIEQEFPVIYGVPGSWAAIMDFVDEYEVQHPRYQGVAVGAAAAAA